MERALNEWVDTMPKGTADVTRDGDVLTLHSCDPGSAVPATKGVSEPAFIIPLFRTTLAIAYAQSGADQNVATCAANEVIAQLPADNLLKLNSLVRSKSFVTQVRSLAPGALQSCQATTG